MPAKVNPGAKAGDTPEEKARKAKEKAERKALFEAKRASEGNKNPSPTVLEAGSKSKADLKKERRAIQEAQRASKPVKDNVPKAVEATSLDAPSNAATPKPQSTPAKPVAPMAVKPSPQIKETTKKLADLKISEKSKEKSVSPLKDNSTTASFPQIPSRSADMDGLIKGLGHCGTKVHSSFISLGLQMNKNVIRSPIPRSVATLTAIKHVITDYVTPSHKDLSRDLLARLRVNMKFLNDSRPHSIGITAAFEFLTLQINKIPPTHSDAEAKRYLFEVIDKYVYEEICCAVKAITQEGANKIKQEGDCILTFGCSLNVQHILHHAWQEQGKRFRVVVVDVGPEYRGLELVRFLGLLDIPTSYVYINAAPFVIQGADKVFLGAHAVLANGYVMSQMGTSQIALLATTHNVPVYVCCATSEFSDAVYTDAFIHNEAGLPREYYNGKNERLYNYFQPPFENDVDTPNKSRNLEVLNLLYDVTPPDFVSVVITEKGVVPCSSVPAVMRRQVAQKIH